MLISPVQRTTSGLKKDFLVACNKPNPDLDLWCYPSISYI